MASKLGNIVFYADHPQALSDFWSDVLGYPRSRIEGELRDFLMGGGLSDEDLAKRGLAEDPEGEGPRVFFHHTADPKASRNRIHLDVQAVAGRPPTRAELEAEKERIVGLGATVVRLVEQDWGPAKELYYQMLDPEGNEFCLQ